jgi:hypothetical protein
MICGVVEPVTATNAMMVQIDSVRAIAHRDTATCTRTAENPLGKRSAASGTVATNLETVTVAEFSPVGPQSVIGHWFSKVTASWALMQSAVIATGEPRATARGEEPPAALRSMAAKAVDIATFTTVFRSVIPVGPHASGEEQIIGAAHL